MRCSFNNRHTEIVSQTPFSSSPMVDLRVLSFLLLLSALYLLTQMETSILLTQFSSKSQSVLETRRGWCFVSRTCWGSSCGAQHGGATWTGGAEQGCCCLFSYLLSFQTDKWHQHCANTSSPAPNVVHNTPYRHPPIQHRWQVAKLNWHQNFPKYIISPQAWLGEPTVQFTCSFCLSAINRLKEVRFSIRSSQNEANEGVLSCLWEVRRTCEHKSTLVWLLCSDSGSGINSCASRKYGDKYTALRNTFCWLWQAQEKTREWADGWMDGGTQSCRWLLFLIQVMGYVSQSCFQMQGPVMAAIRIHSFHQ